jgi:hypothetical protein
MEEVRRNYRPRCFEVRPFEAIIALTRSKRPENDVRSKIERPDVGGVSQADSSDRGDFVDDGAVSGRP